MAENRNNIGRDNQSYSIYKKTDYYTEHLVTIYAFIYQARMRMITAFARVTQIVLLERMFSNSPFRADLLDSSGVIYKKTI